MTPTPATATPTPAGTPARLVLLASDATAWSVPAWLALTGLAVAAALAYACSCWWFPYAACWCCHGDGKHQREDRKVHRLCRWCAGTGRRLRIGRRVYNHYARLRTGATTGRRGR
jgi:hypothetical protein